MKYAKYISPIAVFFLGFLCGRMFYKEGLETKVVVKEVKGEVIRDTLYLPQPIKVVEKRVPIPADTASLYAAWEEYHKQKEYKFDFSTPEVGEFKVDVSLEKNNVVSATSKVQPIIRTVTETKYVNRTPLAQFYGKIGSSLDFNYNNVELGVDLKQRYLIGVTGFRYKENYGYAFNIGVKF